MVFIFPSRAGGSWQAFTQTLDSAQQGGQYSHCSPAIGLPVVTWPAQTGWSVGTPPPRLCSAIRPSSLKAFCAWMWSFSVGGRVCVGECVPASQRSGACSGFSVSVMFRELSESSGSECLGSMTPETQDIYLRMDHHRRRSGYRLGRIIARQQLLKRIAGGRRRDSLVVFWFGFVASGEEFKWTLPGHTSRNAGWQPKHVVNQTWHMEMREWMWDNLVPSEQVFIWAVSLHIWPFSLIACFPDKVGIQQK